MVLTSRSVAGFRPLVNRFMLDARPKVCDSNRMKIALTLTDQSFADTKSVGIFNVSLGLVRGLMQCPEEAELHVLGNRECADYFADRPANMHLHLTDRDVPRRFARVWWDQVGLPRCLRRLQADWALLPKGFPPYFPRLGRTKLACYLHDVNWEYYEQRGRQEGTPFPRHQLLYFRTLGLRCLRVADLVLTSTAFNCERFAAHVPQARVERVGIGFDDPPQPHTEPRGRDVLFYASPYPHKLTRLGLARLERWLAVSPHADGVRVHVLGGLPPGAVLPGPRWVHHGRLPKEDMLRLMQETCRVSVYFSEYEGFGMPPVESLRAGLPCVASLLPPLAENIPARYLFRNEDEADFLRVMDDAYTAETVECPVYPSWREVAQRVLLAMRRCK